MNDLRHKIIILTIVRAILKCIIRYLLMAAYIWTCNRFGLFNYGLTVKIVVTATSIYISQLIMREFVERCSTDIGIIACVKEIYRSAKTGNES